MLDFVLGAVLEGTASDMFTMVKLFDAGNGSLVAEASVNEGTYAFFGLAPGDYAVVAITENGAEKALTVSVMDVENVIDFN